MTTLRVRVAAPTVPSRPDAWALFDAAGACMRTGVDRPDAWPSASSVEFVLAASQLRIVSIKLPPMPSSRVAGAAGFALEDQLAGPVSTQHLAASAQAPDGYVRVVVVARSRLAGIADTRFGDARILAEPDLASPIAGWRWCVAEDAEGFVRRTDGSAFPVEGPSREGALPIELSLALAQSQRDGTAPPHVRVDATFADAALSRWQRETGIAFLRGAPWRWHDAAPAAFVSAINLVPNATATDAATPHRSFPSLFAPALMLAGAALAIHVVASVGEWASLRLETWRYAREWTAIAVAAGVPSETASTPQSARVALARRYADLRHAQGLPAPDDALPLLARAAPALAAISQGSVKSAAFADGHWTLDLARADPTAIRDLDTRMRAARVPALVATSATGTRVRFGGP